MFKVIVPATSANMGPGFDTAGIALALYNEIEVYDDKEVSFSGPFKIESINNIDDRIECSQNIPLDETNLIYKTIFDFSQKVGKPLPRFYLKQNDNIPLTRGLGSSAACIVAGLVIANELLKTNYSNTELLDIAVLLEGHPDNVAPAFIGDMVVGASDGDRFEHVKIPVMDDLQFIALIPDFPLSTEYARAVLPSAYTKNQAIFNCSRSALMVASMMSHNYKALSVAMQDQVHQPYRKILIPDMDYIMKVANDLGCYASYLSGAGPTIMLINDKNNIIEKDLDYLSKSLSHFWLVRYLDVDHDGTRIIR